MKMLIQILMGVDNDLSNKKNLDNVTFSNSMSKEKKKIKI